MTRTEYVEASKILTHLFNTASFVGIDFGSGPNHHLLYFKRGDHEAWLSIEGPWHVQTADLPFDEDMQLQRLIQLRRERVHAVRLGTDNPHLELIFESGTALFVNGFHEQFESWQAGDARPLGGDKYLLVAMPQGELAIFVEEEA
ncbi:hypothetical protein [Exiguobacterium sp.]|uniref:hypothetical protein n=1 Tax=Exiguobacterium sp. TaxID=44751 RepID=UPI00263BB057|nr:hypothetical protein [Exiguobacterium sp.]MCC5892137.1 hypothetical protein [Exiguobacterium sp.]